MRIHINSNAKIIYFFFLKKIKKPWENEYMHFSVRSVHRSLSPTSWPFAPQTSRCLSAFSVRPPPLDYSSKWTCKTYTSPFTSINVSGERKKKKKPPPPPPSKAYYFKLDFTLFPIIISLHPCFIPRLDRLSSISFKDFPTANESMMKDLTFRD